MCVSVSMLVGASICIRVCFHVCACVSMSACVSLCVSVLRQLFFVRVFGQKEQTRICDFCVCGGGYEQGSVNPNRINAKIVLKKFGVSNAFSCVSRHFQKCYSLFLLDLNKINFRHQKPFQDWCQLAFFLFIYLLIFIFHFYFFYIFVFLSFKEGWSKQLKHSLTSRTIEING